MLSILLLVLLSFTTFGESLICNNCIVTMYDNTTAMSCSSCNGTNCYILEYQYQFPQLAGNKGHKMGCLNGPISFPSSCRKNMFNQTLCICSEDYCNDDEFVAKEKTVVLPVVNCKSNSSTYENMGITNCTAHLCETQIEIQSVEVTCARGRSEPDLYLANFDVFQTVMGVILPAGCYRFNATDFYFGAYQICTHPTQTAKLETLQFEKKISCLYDDDYDAYVTTVQKLYCKASLCYVAGTKPSGTYVGCITASLSSGKKLLPGSYNLGDGYMYICDTDRCNDGVDATGTKIIEGETTTQPSFNVGASLEKCCPIGQRDSAGTSAFLIHILMPFLVLKTRSL